MFWDGLLTVVDTQRRRKLRGDTADQSHGPSHWRGQLESAGHLQIQLRNGRGVVPFRQTELPDEIRIVDLRRARGSIPHYAQHA